MRDGDRLIIVKIGKEGKKINNKKKRWKRSERESEGPSPIYSLFIHFPNTYFVLNVLDLWHFKQRIKQVLNAPLMNTTAFPFTELKEKRTRQK